MSAKATIEAAQARSITLYVEDDQLKTLAKKGAMTDEIRQQIRANKEEIIAYLQSLEQTGSASGAPNGSAASTQQEAAPAAQWYALSFAQQRLWFIDKLEGRSNQYNIPIQFRLHGSVDNAALEQALTTIIQRHEVLRTEFKEHGGATYQRARDPFNFHLKVLDLRPLAANAREAEVQRLAAEDARADFDLRVDLLLRAQMLQLPADEHVLLMNMHHIASDGWSMTVFFNELEALYHAYCQGRANPLPPLSIQYADYAHWQREWLQGDVLEQQLTHWRRQMAGSPPVHNLPLDYARPEEQRFIGTAYSRRLSISLVQSLNVLCQQHDVTLFMLLQTAFAVLISRYSNEQDVVMGTPVAGRTHADTEALIGFFINTLPLRTQFDDDTSFAQLLADSKQTILNAFTHQQIPFEMLVEQLQPERSLRYSPVFQILFALQNNDRGARQLAGLELEPVQRAHSIIKFDLELIASEQDDALLLNWNYNTELFAPAAVERLADSFEALLRGIVADASQAVAALPILSEQQRDQLLIQCDRAEIFARDDIGLHELFEQQAKLRPDAIALVFEDCRISYRQLNAKANQLAHYLRDQGVKADTLVGLCLDRGVEVVVGILAILKAGGAYVPIDPKNPHDRIAYMVADSAIEWMLSHSGLIAELPFQGLTALALDQMLYNGELQGHDTADADKTKWEFSASQLAYVIYTSGSTGQPKGVLIEHGNVTRLFKAADRQFDFNAADTWTLFHSHTFDFSVWELWGALAHGGRLLVVPYWVTRSTAEFYQLLEQECVTVLSQTPSAFTRLIDVDKNSVIDNNTATALKLRYVVFGGEALNTGALLPWFERHGDSLPILVNMYGITETTVHVTFYRLHQESATDDLANSPIGRPLSDLSVYVLNPYHQLCPIGVAGELHVGGAGLARAYLNREALTAERFVHNPFAAASANSRDARLYKTGDVGRLLADGSLEYVGRTDDQVKIRGFRIELGEIEHQLAACDGVKDAVVVVRTDQEENDSKRLVAYVAVDVKDDARESALIAAYRQQLASKLPGYMVPAAFVLMAMLPLTGNGKIDRKQLPEPDWSRYRHRYVAPRDEVEQHLTTIYQELLPVDQVGIDDGFFELGGDSITSIQLVAKARQHGLKLEVRDVFKHQTVRALAPAVILEQANSAEQGVVSGDVALTPVQSWFAARAFSEPHHWNQSMLYKLPGEINLPALQSTLDALVDHHDALRLCYPAADWQAQAIAAESRPVPLRYEVLGNDTASSPSSSLAETVRAITDEVQSGLSLETGRLINACLFRMPNGGHRLMVAIHHLAVDGISWRILQEDLRLGYAQAQRGEAIKLPPKSHSFKDWSQHLRRCVTDGLLEQELAYWQAQAARVQPLYQQHDGRNLVRYSRVEQQRLSATLTEQLLRHVHRAYNTQINDVLLAALLLGYSRWSGQDTLSLHMEGHGREHLGAGLDVSRTVGWFTAIYPLTLSTKAYTDRLGDVLMGVKEQLRAIPNKGVGYGLLRYLHPDEAVRASLQPAAPVALSFNYLGQFGQGQLQPNEDDGLFDLAQGETGSKFAAGQECVDRLSVMASIYQGRLRIACQYSNECYDDEAIAQFIEHYLAALTELINHCQLPDSMGRTPSDYSLCRLNQAELDGLRNAFGDESGDSLAAIYPLSSVQQGMLFHSRMESDAGHYVVQIGLDIDALNQQAFKQAWRQLLDTHAILRTAFWGLDGERPHQVVLADVDLPWTELDWSRQPANEQPDRWQELLAQDRQLGFDVDQAPLMRGYLITLGGDTCRFLWSHHHALMDGWSLPLVFRDLQLAYRGQLTGQAANLRTEAEFADYIEWLSRQNVDTAKTFWRNHLQGVEAPTPLSFGETNILSDRGSQAMHGITMTANQTEQLQTISQRHHLTMSTLLQGAWGLLLSRYSGESSVVFGATVSGRPADLHGVDEIVGPFINTLPARANIRAGQSLLEYLQGLQDVHLQREHYGFLPLVEIQQCSEVTPGTPLFESLVVFENYPTARLSEEQAADDQQRLNISGTKSSEQTHYPITLSLAVPRGCLSIRAFYDDGRFSAESIERVLTHYRQLLEEFIACADPSVDNSLRRPLNRVNMLTPVETGLLAQWNDTASELPPRQTIHELFQRQVGVSPQAPAVVMGEQSLSYAELDVRSNQLAHDLQARGVTVEQRVGVCLDREPLLLVALLGIMKAGGVYVPLDPEYPQERLAFMVADAGMKWLLSSAAVAVAGELSTAGVEVLDLPAMDLSAYPASAPATAVWADNLAYLIYTSGSTGRPKGVSIRHGGAAAMLSWAVAEFGAQNLSGVLASTSICFDLSVYELFAPLCVGGRVILARDALSLLGFTQWDQVTLVNTVPSAIDALVSVQTLPESARIVNLAGEALSRETVDRVYAQSSIERVYNLYGPSEDTTYSTGCWVPANVPDMPAIGRPVSNTQAYVLDGNLQRAPVGVVGELYLGGQGLARGYLDRPALTADRFMPNPHGLERGERMYRTGDLCRYRPDGELEYMGRIDHQVKVRGFRIELGEIESYLRWQTGVEGALVQVLDGELGQQLVAYVVLQDEIDEADLKQALQSNLPAYMVPLAIIRLDTWPLTPNGKVDRDALPAPDWDRYRKTYVAPRDATEEALAVMYCELLNLDQVGIDDNFFELGGHSLLATRLLSRVREAFGVELPLRRLFSEPTIAGIRRIIEGLSYQDRAQENLAKLSRDEGTERVIL